MNQGPSITFLAISAFCLYVFFAVCNLDVYGRARYYIGNPWYGIGIQRDGPDKTVSFGGLFPKLYAFISISLILINPSKCTIYPDGIKSFYFILLLFNIFIASKVLLGPIQQNFKSVKIVGENKFSRPFSFVLYDFFRAIPANLTINFAFKLSAVAIFAGIVFSLRKVGIMGPEHKGIPLAIEIAWILACLGRVNHLLLTYDASHVIIVAANIGAMFVCSVVGVDTDLLLEGCGLPSGLLPSYVSAFWHAI